MHTCAPRKPIRTSLSNSCSLSMKRVSKDAILDWCLLPSAVLKEEVASNTLPPPSRNANAVLQSGAPCGGLCVSFYGLVCVCPLPLTLPLNHDSVQALAEAASPATTNCAALTWSESTGEGWSSAALAKRVAASLRGVSGGPFGSERRLSIESLVAMVLA